MWFLWSLYTTYYILIHRQFMQLSIYNRYESHYVILLPSQLIRTRFMYICIPKELRWPRHVRLLRYLWVALHNASWNRIVSSLNMMYSNCKFCRIMSRHSRAGTNLFILVLSFISKHSLARCVARDRQPLLQIRIWALLWAAMCVL